MFKKETLCPKRYYLSIQAPGASERLTMKARVQYFYNYGWWQTRTSYESRCSQKILCQKIKLDKSQTWKGGLGKNERLGGLKTRKGGPGKS